MTCSKKVIIFLGLFLFLQISCHANQSIISEQNPANQKVDIFRIQFDVKRVNQPTVLQYAKKPLTWRAYLPICPPGSHYVSGVNPQLVQLDYPPNYPYCNCICNGNCGGLNGITAPSGQPLQPVYTASVTCETQIQNWTNHFKPKIEPTPHQYYYCQSGTCTTNPLPADLGYPVPTGGYANTIKIDFLACQIAAVTGCGTPDPISLSRQ